MGQGRLREGSEFGRQKWVHTNVVQDIQQGASADMQSYSLIIYLFISFLASGF
jgi:hypothetical protein